MNRLLFAISAFGVIFYYRKLSDEDEDISFIDPQTSQVDVTVWSMNEFFNEWLCDDEIIETFLDKTLLEQAQQKYGKLVENKMYCFLPPLRMGGCKVDLNLDIGSTVVHLDLLYQLAIS